MQVGAVVHELDEPVLVAPSTVGGLPRPASRAMGWLGFRYLLMHRFAETPGIFAVGPDSGEVERLEEFVPA